MSSIKDLLNVGLVAQSANLALSNLKRKRKGFLSQGFDNILGASMIKAEANIIGGID